MASRVWPCAYQLHSPDSLDERTAQADGPTAAPGGADTRRSDVTDERFAMTRVYLGHCRKTQDGATLTC